VRNLFPWIAAVLSAVVWLPPSGRSQEREFAVWRIEIRGGEAAKTGEYSIDLEDLAHHTVAAGDLLSDNCFEFRNITYGDYWVTVSDAQRNIVYRGLVTARAGTWQETIDLGQRRERQRAPGGPVSISDLRHPPSRKAVEAFMAAQKFAQNGQPAAAAEQLEKAIRLSPDYVEAHTNLAAQYVRLGHPEEAIAESRRAIELSKPNAADLGNMAYAQYLLNRRQEAIQSAQAGLEIEPGSPKLHYILGMLLATDPKTLAQSIPHLELAARTIVSARVNLEVARQALR